MIDMHTHLLHDIDDGAKGIEDAVAYLSLQKKAGVGTVVLTPHFKPDSLDFDSFCNLRQQRYEELLPQAQALGVELVLGCEVLALDGRVLELDLKQLTIGQSTYLLIEFLPTVSKYTIFHIVKEMVRRGFTPILAHVERYNVLRNDPDALYELVEEGALLQINGSTALSDKGYYTKCMKKNLIQLVASDTHGTDQRPPNLAAAYAHLAKRGVDVARLRSNAEKIVANDFLELGDYKRLIRVGKLYL